MRDCPRDASFNASFLPGALEALDLATIAVEDPWAYNPAPFLQEFAFLSLDFEYLPQLKGTMSRAPPSPMESSNTVEFYPDRASVAWNPNGTPEGFCGFACFANLLIILVELRGIEPLTS